MKKIWLLNVIIFLAAFLLFQIELIIAKVFLPQYGGSYLVWGACVVFFQGALLLGYIFAHLIVSRLGIARYLRVHVCLLFLPLLCFPGRPLPAIFPQTQIPVVIDIFWQLMGSIGMVFFVLSTMSIIVQSWLASSELPEHSTPYTLYAVSNLGSFAAILTYPPIFEWNFDLSTQILIWRGCYVALIALNLAAFAFIRVKTEEVKWVNYGAAVSTHQLIRWFMLGAAGVIMFVSVTNIFTSEVAPIPLLWIIPLSIYLLSFVLNFKRRPWCPDWIRENLHVTIGFSLILFFMTQKNILPFVLELVLYSISLFIICMYCQNELHHYKPGDQRKLTLFYVVISLGGFFGGIMVSWIVPLLFNSTIEYLIGFFIISMALVIGQEKSKVGFYNIRLIVYMVVFLILWPMKFVGYNVFGIIFILFIFKNVFTEFKRKPRAFSLGLLLILFLAPLIEMFCTQHYYVYAHRNYYGIYNIYEENGVRYLVHGTTIHGAQYLNEKKQGISLTYYSANTPVGELLLSEKFTFGRIGVIGLGTGSLAAYNDRNRVMDFFELDPDVLGIVTEYFSFLWKMPGQVNYIMGDARLSMDSILPKRYDLILVDAFSGDSIPLHLLTTEAISKYREHLKDNGLILFHISNHYLNLSPVLESNADHLRAYYSKKSNPGGKNYTFASDWVALTWNRQQQDKLVSVLKWIPAAISAQKMRPWTDQYSNVLAVLKTQYLLDGIKTFKPFYW